MKKFRRKSPELEGFQWKQSEFLSTEHTAASLNAAARAGHVQASHDSEGPALLFHDGEDGPWLARPGDWFLRDPEGAGRWFPVPAKDFEDTYEEVESSLSEVELRILLKDQSELASKLRDLLVRMGQDK